MKILPTAHSDVSKVQLPPKDIRTRGEMYRQYPCSRHGAFAYQGQWMQCYLITVSRLRAASHVGTRICARINCMSCLDKVTLSVCYRGVRYNNIHTIFINEKLKLCYKYEIKQVKDFLTAIRFGPRPRPHLYHPESLVFGTVY